MPSSQSSSTTTSPQSSSSSSSIASRYSGNRIYLYVPNVIGYIRVLLSLLCTLWLYDRPALFSTLYIVSFVLDAVDGHVARAFNQCSQFGAVLDMITDRFSTAALVIVLLRYYSNRAMFALLVFANVLDFASHWIRMYSTLVVGESSHKNTNPLHPRILQIYYANKFFMAPLCIGAEIFYMALYWMHFYSWTSTVTVLVFYVTLCPLWFTKQVVNVVQLCSAAQDIVEWEYANGKHHKAK